MLRRILVFALLLILAVPAFAQAEEIYTEPGGLYSFPIPTNWQVIENDGYVTAIDPDELLVLHFMTAPLTDDLEAAVAEAWLMVEPEFDLEIIDVMEITEASLLDGFDLAVNITYDTPPTRAVVGGVITYEDVAYFTLLDLDIATLQRRAAQLQLILTGFTATALEQDDLTGAEALPIDDAMIAEVERLIEKWLEQNEIPGLSIAIVQGGEVLYTNGFGVKEMGGDDPITPDTYMMIGSTTKTMVTMMMGSLIDDGLMTWDTPVIEILPSFAVADPEITETLTLRNLVCACTGVPRRDIELVFNSDDMDAEDIIESLATFEFFTDFGEAFQYSNQMIATAGYVTALAAGADYGDLYNGFEAVFQERILDPIGMARSTFDFDVVENSDDYAIPHSAVLEGGVEAAPLSAEYWLAPIAPAGTLWSTAEDMAQYMLTILNDGTTPDGVQVISADNLQETWQPQISIDANNNYGLGWIVGTYKNVPTLGHGGNTIGFTSEMLLIPSLDLGVIVLTNARATNTINAGVAVRLFELIYDIEPEIETQIDDIIARNEANEEEPNFGELDAEAVAPFVGVWANDALGELILTLEDGVLLADAGEFITELRPLLDDDDELLYYIMTEGPLLGVNITLESGEGDEDTDEDTDEAGEPRLILGGGALEYVFYSAGG